MVSLTGGASSGRIRASVYRAYRVPMTEVQQSSNGQVIARAAQILAALEAASEGRTVSELARTTGLPRTTVHRLASALLNQQLLVEGERGLRLGPAIARLATAAHTDMVAVARPHIEALGRRTRETVDLCLDRGTHAISVDQYVSDRELRVVSHVGTAFPIHYTAHGKALLAVQDEARLASVLGETLQPCTAASHTRLTTLQAELGTVRRTGIAVDREEHADGVCGLGVYIRTGLSGNYAVSLAVPALRFEPHYDELAVALRKCRAEIEAVFQGGR